MRKCCRQRKIGGLFIILAMMNHGTNGLERNVFVLIRLCILGETTFDARAKP